MDSIGAMTVVAGNLLSVERKQASSVVTEAVDTLLFAQLAADLSVEKLVAPAQWFDRFLQAMMMSKWGIRGQFISRFELGVDTNITLEGLIKTGLSDRLSSGQADAVAAMVVKVGSLPETDAVQCLFRQRVLKPLAESDKSGLSVAPVSRLALQISLLEQRATLHSLFVTFDTAVNVDTDMFHQVFSSQDVPGAIDLRYYRQEWDSAAYSKVRPNVEAFLAGKKKGLILPVMAGTSKNGCTPEPK